MLKPVYTPMPQQEQAEEPAAPEWQYDKWGKKYRKVGNCIEYAPTITVDGVEVYQDELEEFHKRNREVQQKWREEEALKAQQTRTDKICPLQDALHIQKKCSTDCAMYTATGCAMKHRKAAADTAGKPCPYMRQCKADCALYDQGCTI